MLKILFFILVLETTKGKILVINETEYFRMPPIYHLDPYEQCIYEANGIYCNAKITLVPDGPSKLYSLIQNCSAHTYTRYNHSKLDYGICLTRTCKNIYQQNKTQDPRMILERCLNESFWENYKLKTLVSESVVCNTYKENINLELKDQVLLSVLLVILMLNVIGSLREIYLEKDDREQSFLACFSIQHNWKKLVTPVGEDPDPKRTSLKCLHGVRTVVMVTSIMGHTLAPLAMGGENPHYIEQAYNKFYIIILANGALVTQINLVISGFLLAYNLQLYLEKHPSSWTTIVPKAIYYRWIRVRGGGRRHPHPCVLEVWALAAAGSLIGKFFKSVFGFWGDLWFNRGDRGVYSALVRPVYCFFVATALLSMFFKLEDTFRGVLEWSGWRITGRLSYSVYLIHLTIMRYLFAQHHTLPHTTYTLLWAMWINFIVLSYLAGIVLFLLVEAPITQLLKLSVSSLQRNNNANEQQSNDDKINKSE